MYVFVNLLFVETLLLQQENKENERGRVTYLKAPVHRNNQDEQMDTGDANGGTNFFLLHIHSMIMIFHTDNCFHSFQDFSSEISKNLT